MNHRWTQYSHRALPGGSDQSYRSHHLYSKRPGDLHTGLSDRRLEKSNCSDFEKLWWNCCPVSLFTTSAHLFDSSHQPKCSLVRGDCRRCARVALHNLIIDGDRSHLGRIPEASSIEHPAIFHHLNSEELEDDGGDGQSEERAVSHAVSQFESDAMGSTSPLILLGNNEGQIVNQCVVKDPR